MFSAGGLSLGKLQAAWKEVRECVTVNLPGLWEGWPGNCRVTLPLTLVRKLRHTEIVLDAPFFHVLHVAWGLQRKQSVTGTRSQLGFHAYLPAFLLKLLLKHLKCLNILGFYHISKFLCSVPMVTSYPEIPLQGLISFLLTLSYRPSHQTSWSSNSTSQTWSLSCPLEVIRVTLCPIPTTLWALLFDHFAGDIRTILSNPFRLPKSREYTCFCLV